MPRSRKARCCGQRILVYPGSGLSIFCSSVLCGGRSLLATERRGDNDRRAVVTVTVILLNAALRLRSGKQRSMRSPRFLRMTAANLPASVPGGGASGSGIPEYDLVRAISPDPRKAMRWSRRKVARCRSPEIQRPAADRRKRGGSATFVRWPPGPARRSSPRCLKGNRAVQGSGRAVITATAWKTEIRALIATSSTAVEQPTPLQMEIARIGSSHARIAVIAIAVGCCDNPHRLDQDDGDLVAVLLLGLR